ncbi:uncharacterized protein [Chelonus insularis]|uniref:uncharacterized protein n=1 Tax=Chelonus insularis TaxID=460826 RepID=UPI00158849AD|nr:uncharacterized protein LOC118074884 [Chelonus insularis]
MKLPKVCLLFILLSFAAAEKEDEVDISSAFMEVASSFFSEESPGTSKFMDSNAEKKSSGAAGLGQILNGIGQILSSSSGGGGGQESKNQGMDLSMLGPLLQMVTPPPSRNSQQERSANDVESNSPGIDFESVINVASMFMGANSNNNFEGIMGFLPMIFENFNSGTGGNKKHDHSDHSWYMPPVLENLHVVSEHFRNSELGQALWKNSGLAHIVGSMIDGDGRIKYEQLLESFENPSIRRRWIKSLTNFVAEWFSHVSDPNVQTRYLTTVQLIGNGFLKSQGFPKTALFDPLKPTESLTRLVNAGAKRYLNMNLDSAKYIRPAVAYAQDLIKLASEKGFIMSRVNANELSNRLSHTINNDIISPILKTYRAYKWAVKSPMCAAHILCVINSKDSIDHNDSILRSSLTKISSFPAAWAISSKTNISFWNLYGAIRENDECFSKYPVNCNDFHEEEIRVTTEAIHNEL